MPKWFGVWRRLWRSAYSAAVYREAAAGGVRSALGYLVALIAVTTVVITPLTHVQTNRALQTIKPLVLEHVPELIIQNGHLSSPVAQPYVWEHEGFGFIVDTTGTVTVVSPVYDQGVLLTETELIYRRSLAETRRYSLSEFTNVVINQETLKRWFDALASWLWVFVAIGTLAWLWIAKLVQILLWSGPGWLAAKLTRRSLSYRAVFNLAVVAITVPIAFDLLALELGWADWRVGVASLALYAAYLAWGIFVQPAMSAMSSGRGTA